MKNSKIIYSYLHGFGANSNSYKGLELKKYFRSSFNPEIKLHLPDLNNPSFNKITISGALEVIDDLYHREKTSDDTQFCLVCSSFGGYIGSIYANKYPDRVKKLLLLCPAFDFANRWKNALGDLLLDNWKNTNRLDINRDGNEETMVHYQLYEDAIKYDPFPIVQCDTKIIHGENDIIVPIDSSYQFINLHNRLGYNIEMITCQDIHTLVDSLSLIESTCASFFDLNKQYNNQSHL